MFLMIFSSFAPGSPLPGGLSLLIAIIEHFFGGTPCARSSGPMCIYQHPPVGSTSCINSFHRGSQVVCHLPDIPSSLPSGMLASTLSDHRVPLATFLQECCLLCHLSQPHLLCRRCCSLAGRDQAVMLEIQAVHENCTKIKKVDIAFTHFITTKAYKE